MNVDTAIQNRRAVKRFDPDHKITKKTRDKLLSTGLLFPSSFNIQNWHFVVVDDPEQRKHIRGVAWNQPPVTEAALLIILCTNLEAWREESLHCWHSSQQSFEDFFETASRSPFRGLDQMQRDEVMRSCGIVVQTLMLAAQGAGYDSCLIEGFDEDAVGDLINLPEDHAVCMLLAIGKSLDDLHPRQMDLPLEEVVINDHF